MRSLQARIESIENRIIKKTRLLKMSEAMVFKYKNQIEIMNDRIANLRNRIFISSINYEQRKAFFKKFEEWRKANKITHREIISRLGLTSSANYSIWLTSEKPQISQDNLEKLSQWSGVEL